MLRSSFEEKVFQKVGHPRFAIVLVKGTNQISDVNCDGLFGKIRKKQHPQSVGQAILRNALNRSDTLDPVGQDWLLWSSKGLGERQTRKQDTAGQEYDEAASLRYPPSI